MHGLMRFGMAVPIGFSCQRINTVDCVGVTVAQKLDAATLVAHEYISLNPIIIHHIDPN